MKIDWNLVIAFVIALAIFKLLDKLFLDAATQKIAQGFEEVVS